jgi:hypothetical protein
MIRVYTTNEPLKVFLTASFFFLLATLFLFGRYLYFIVIGETGGHIQSLILGLVLFSVSGFLATVGVLAELINANRKLIEEILKITRDRKKSG